MTRAGLVLSLVIASTFSGCGDPEGSSGDDTTPDAGAGRDGGPTVPDAGPCPAGCFIGDVCFGDGDRDPERPCFGCDTAVARNRFVPLTGVSCDDGAFCTVDDVCTAGTCDGETRDCDDGIACNGGEGCDVVADACAPLGSNPCVGDEVCDLEIDECVVECPEGCVIDAMCVPPGMTRTGNRCEACDPERDPSGWSSAIECDDGVACNGLEVCVPGTGACRAGRTTCGDGEECDVDADMCVCEEGLTDCSGDCVDTDTDPDHCGTCGFTCTAGCAGGMCTTDLVPGSTGETTRRGWSVRCQSWSGDLCTRPQVRVSCGTCTTYSDCGDWHDLTPFNTAASRAAPVFCELATGASGVTRTATGGSSATPRACGWNSSTHPLCESTRASLARTGAGSGVVGGLLTNDDYCDSSTNLLHVECTGW